MKLKQSGYTLNRPEPEEPNAYDVVMSYLPDLCGEDKANALSVLAANGGGKHLEPEAKAAIIAEWLNNTRVQDAMPRAGKRTICDVANLYNLMFRLDSEKVAKLEAWIRDLEAA